MTKVKFYSVCVLLSVSMKSIEHSTGTKKFLLICWVGCCSLFAWNHASDVILLQVPELVPNVVNRNASG